MFPASSPAFIVWKNGKSKIVINLRRINTRLYFDAYLSSKQDIILFFFRNFQIFSFIDLIKGFFQQKIESHDRWKTTFVTPHRGLKWLTIFNMRLNNTSDFFQSKMEKIFGTYLWKLVLVYMNNIIVYSRDQDQHLKYLNKVLNLFHKLDVTLTLKKCHFTYSSIKVLRHHFSKLNLSILEEKTKAIRDL